MTEHSPPSRLLGLPPERRNRIDAFLFSSCQSEDYSEIKEGLTRPEVSILAGPQRSCGTLLWYQISAASEMQHDDQIS